MDKAIPDTPNKVVAFRLNTARQLCGWTQDEAAARLEPYLGKRWSPAVFSAAERSAVTDRVREFTADELIAFAAAFRLPVSYFLTPPPDAAVITARGAPQGLARPEVMDLAFGGREAIEARVDEELGHFGPDLPDTPKGDTP